MSYILDALKKSQQQRDLMNGEQEPANASSQVGADARADGRGFLWLASLLAVLMLLLLLWAVLHMLPLREPDIPGYTPPLGQVDRVSVQVKAPQIKAVASAVAVDTDLLPPETTKKTEVPGKPERSVPPLSVLRSIPQLMVNSHIYSPVAEKRSVVLNNRSYQEGDWLADGVFIKEITADGIQLDAQGWLVHVGRSKGWQAIP